MPGSAPAVPAQTPCSFLKGGGAAMFSAECLDAIAKARFDPEWFGSYDHVAKLNKSARDKCAAFDALSPAAQAAAPPGTQPSVTDRYLAASWSGHLVQNAVCQSSREDPCSNLVDGFEMNHAPCCPMEGSPTDPTTEHGLVTLRERQQSGSVGAPGTPYPEATRQAHEDSRTREFVDRHQQRMQEFDKQHGPAGQQGGGAGGAAGSGGQAGGASGAQPNAPAAASASGPDKATLDKAADCINNWRKAAEAEMKSRCQNNTAKNQGRGANATAADTAAQQAKQQAAQARAHADANPNDPAAQAAAKTAEDRAAQAGRKASRAGNAQCRGEQGARLGAGTGRSTGEVPRNAIVTPTTGSSP